MVKDNKNYFLLSILSGFPVQISKPSWIKIHLIEKQTDLKSVFWKIYQNFVSFFLKQEKMSVNGVRKIILI